MTHASPRAFVRAAGASFIAAATFAAAGPAAAQQARIRQLNDIAFGTIGSATVDLVRTDNLCVYSTAASGRYTVTARGSGSSNAFTLVSGSNTLPYEVQWAFASGQASGIMLSPNVALAGTTTNRNSATCGTNRLTASLIVVLRSNAQQSATAGNYAGTLTLIVAPN